MNFTLSAEHRQLAATARDYLDRHFPADLVGALADSPGGWDADSWAAVVSLGWLDPTLDAIGRTVIAEATGYALYPGPWWSTVGLAGLTTGEPATLAWAETGVPTLDAAARGVTCRAERSGGGVALFGRKIGVPDATSARFAVVAAATPDGTGLFLVDLAAHADAIRPVATVDTTRRLSELHLAGVPAEPMVPATMAIDVLRATRRRALAMLAAEAVGVATRALETAAAHASAREQFGRPIGTFQAISHRIADMYVGVELARSLSLRAAWCLAESHPDTDEAIAVATVTGRQAALRATEGAIQVLGGIGFTWEHPAHRWYKRALWLHGFDGFPREHRARLASMLLDGDADPQDGRDALDGIVTTAL